MTVIDLTLTMEMLSCDVLCLIFQELDGVTLCRIAQVSKDFRIVSDEDRVWDVAHGFTKGKSLEILSELGALVNTQNEKCLSASFELRHSFCSKKYENWSVFEEELRITQARQLVGYRMLRVPKKLRTLASDALVYYHRLNRCIDAILVNAEHGDYDSYFSDARHELYCKRADAQQALADSNEDILDWENSFADCRELRSMSYSLAFCCTHQPWGISPSLETLENLELYE